MDDLISRQAAIEMIQRAFDRETLLYSFVRKVAVDALKTMPSAQPEQTSLPDKVSEEIGDKDKLKLVEEKLNQLEEKIRQLEKDVYRLQRGFPICWV